MTNRLSSQKSPYLRQHSENPVDWYPWGEKAFEKARELDMPIFLSIGYSTCHWCHVMARESFEDPSLAQKLNSTFISIKVDREERPDIDSVYMKAAMLATGRGGWPLSIFMTPGKEPFFAATYIPRESRYGMMGFGDIIDRIGHLWKSDRKQLTESAREITNALRSGDPSNAKMDPDIIEKAFNGFSRGFDEVHGGFSNAPKFPSPHQIMFLMRHHHSSGNERGLEMAKRTLEAMALGGLFDHVGGGFHRYSTDREWLVPHFEKMLYDQAMMIMAYSEGFLALGKDLFRNVVERTSEYVIRDLRSREGLFVSAEDADSEGEEGKFYVWTYDEIMRILRKEKGKWFADLFNVERKGNFRDEAAGKLTGKNILHLSGEVSYGDVRLPLSILLKERSKRIRPGKDTKVLTDWNALMISALSRAGQALSRKDLIVEAERAMKALEKHSSGPDGKWYHRYMEGERAVDAMIDDVAFLSNAYMDLYEGTFDPSYLEKAIGMIELLERDFLDGIDGGFFGTSHGSERLISRQKEAYDGAMPSGNSMAVWALIRASRMTGRTDMEDLASDTMKAFARDLGRAPTGHAMMLSAYMHATGPAREIVIAEGEDHDNAIKMVGIVRRTFLPTKVALLKNGNNGKDLERISPFTEENIPIDGRTTAYVCQGWNCDVPVTDVKDLESSLIK